MKLIYIKELNIRIGIPLNGRISHLCTAGTEKLDIGPLQRNEVPIRVFPLQKDNNENENWLSMGMLATKNNPNDIKVNIRDVFETIPDNVTEEDF